MKDHQTLSNSFEPSHLAGLNPAQREAVLSLEGPVLVVAGAGSGKTRMLVHRITHLLDSGVEGRRILAVTFTNRAAAEMRERVAATAGKRGRGLTLSTFHSLGARILRDHGALAGLPDRFAIYSTGDQLSLLKRITHEEVHVAATAGTESWDLARVLSRISGWKNRLVTPAEAAREVAEGRMRGNRDDDYAVLAADVYPRYEESLRAAGACDFDDLLLLPVTILREQTSVREALWRRWHYLMIDEYQDTNGVQLEMARLLAGPRRNLCVVGDDDQSIYAWRGADVENILEFEKHFGGAKLIVLDENYRSTQRILDAANAVIANNSARREKRMRTTNGPGAPVDYWEFDTAEGRSAEENEAAMIVREIGIRQFQERLRWSDFAALYRANHQARPIEEALRAANIPYRVIGGTSYFDRKEVADAAAYFRVLLNPNDDIALRRIINYPTRGIGRVTLLRLAEVARERGLPISAVLPGAANIDGIAPAQAATIVNFDEMLARWRTALRRAEEEVSQSATEGSLAAWAEAYIAETGLENTIRAEAKGGRAGEIRIENLRDFLTSIRSWEQRVWAEAPLPDEEVEWSPPTLHAFLQRISLVPESESGEEGGRDQVTLMTMHGAKGLEFAHVFIAGLEEELLPHARSLHEVAESPATDPIAEERRLFYVAMTRAKRRLTLSGCRRRRKGTELTERMPSRFLKEIPSELLEARTADRLSSLTNNDRQELKRDFFSRMREMLGDAEAGESRK
ncbi:MAG: UvrD-helicase domain-containing protein [Gemmatimonadota bacterium]|nr:UvrD-helicase domain-containing protein [Gemmatimonadota bacterium]